MPHTDQNNILGKTNRDILDTLVKVLFYFSLPLVILSLLRISKVGVLPVMYLHVLLVIILLLNFLFLNKISYRIKVGSVLSVFFLIGIGSALTYIRVINAIPAFTLGIMFSSVFLTKRKTIFFQIFQVLTLSLFIFLNKEKTNISQQIFEVFSYTVFFSYYVVFAIDKLKSKFINVIQNLSNQQNDLTEMKKLIETTQQDAKIGSWSVDLATNKPTWSDETYRIHELPIGSEVSVEQAINFYHPDDRDTISKAVEKGIKDGTPWDMELRFITAKERLIWVRAIGRVKFNEKNEPYQLIGSFQDITEKKKSEIAKDTFLATMSHEMRTPLTAVIGMTELLQETNLNEKQKELSRSIENGGNLLLTIINDVLDLSKLSNEKLVISPKVSNLKEAIEDVIEILSIQAKQKNIELVLNYELDHKVFNFDPLRVRQIFQNLIGNAVKFTDKGSITISATKNARNAIEFKVTDTGRGMPKELIPHVFNPFEQDTSDTASKKGTGLGLSITQKLVHMMFGDIKVESELGVGTTFTFTLALKEVNEEISSPSEDLSKTSFKDKHILLVDDTPMNLMLLDKMLQDQGCKLTSKTNGQEAVEFIKSSHQKIDLVIMDIQMPELDGIAAVGLIRDFEHQNDLKPLPFVAFSAFTFDDDIDKAINAGFNDYLAKPVKKDQLLEKIIKNIESN